MRTENWMGVLGMGMIGGRPESIVSEYERPVIFNLYLEHVLCAPRARSPL